MTGSHTEINPCLGTPLCFQRPIELHEVDVESLTSCRPVFSSRKAPPFRQGDDNVNPSRCQVWQYGCGSKLSSWGYAGFGLCFHLPGIHFGYWFCEPQRITIYRTNPHLATTSNNHGTRRSAKDFGGHSCTHWLCYVVLSAGR